MNSKNSKTFAPRKLLINLKDKMNFKRSDEYVAPSNIGIYYTWKNIKKVIRTFKVSAPKWNEEIELPDGSYFVSDIQNQFEYVLKNMEKRLIILQ